MVDLHARPTVDAAELELPDDAIQAESVPDALDDLRPPSLSSPVIPTPEDVIPTSQPDPHPPSSPTSEPGSLRRTTRLRKSLFPASAGSTQPLPTRRKVSRQEPPSSGAFAGMTAVALKALTSSNTNRNQKYLAAKLETEVVRRDGARPESPAVKIRTIAQREQEERSTQRKARAARRARRSDDGLSETEGLSDIGNSSAMDLYSDDVDSSPVRRHRRGPGDEEDYETPKVGRSAKRPSSHSPSNEEGQVGKKRVKWHRGLSTAVFLDEVEPGTKARPKENVVKKGCLAPTAKALQLDPLGNHLNAESPLKDLVEENIVVKKFVYENDDEPVQPAVAVKNTRSKAKKKS
ncbi:hypothetical protein B0H15DRAFT_773040 [Mycena belliarum]|uniref:Uncharacterized protein n=1 Tax=Mycena belliarum TaxID=1033014 RepID=A0AAD6UG47_9AGAR|nr:hypothetical protein B0H15DRAFT_773040 [Mycena belliae]